MAKQRTPTNVLDARGSFKKDPKRGRARQNEPVVTEELTSIAPDDVPVELHARWAIVVPRIPAGVAKICDWLIVQQLCALIEEFNAAPFDFPTAKHGEMRRISGALGMTPADRSKVSVPKTEENEFDDL